jgi:hypothetical protein
LISLRDRSTIAARAHRN